MDNNFVLISTVKEPTVGFPKNLARQLVPQVVGNLSADDPPTKGTNPRCNDRGGKTAEHKMHAGPVWNDPVYDSVGVPNQQCNTADDAAALRGDALPFLARSTQFRFAWPQVSHPPFHK